MWLHWLSLDLTSDFEVFFCLCFLVSWWFCKVEWWFSNWACSGILCYLFAYLSWMSFKNYSVSGMGYHDNWFCSEDLLWFWYCSHDSIHSEEYYGMLFLPSQKVAVLWSCIDLFTVIHFSECMALNMAI